MPTGARLTKHICTSQKGDCYRIPEDEEQEAFPPC